MTTANKQDGINGGQGAPVKVWRPESLEEALALLSAGPKTIFAGGTDLMVRKRQWQGARRRFTQEVVLIQQLAELSRIERCESADEQGRPVRFWSIGAAVSQQAVVEHLALPEYLRAVVAQMGTPAIRNVATIGGNVVNAASVADTLPPLIAVDAKVRLRSVDGQREMLVADFVTGKYQTAMRRDELLEAILLPDLPVVRFSYHKLGNRRASILSKVSVLVLWLAEADADADAQAAVEAIRIAIGAVNDTVIRDASLEALYRNSAQISEGPKNEASKNEAPKNEAQKQEGYLDQLLAGYRGLMHATDDKRSTKHYKENVALRLIRHCLEEPYA